MMQSLSRPKAIVCWYDKANPSFIKRYRKEMSLYKARAQCKLLNRRYQNLCHYWELVK